MKPNYWRTLAEIIGVISIVAGLLMVAWEIRQANEIARAEIVLSLAEQYNEFNRARFESAEVAELSLMLMRPGDYDLTDIDRSKMGGVAWHFGNIFWSAQIAHDSGLLSDEDLMVYQSQLAWMLKYMPGLVEEFGFMWASGENVSISEAAVFKPLKDHMENAAESAGSDD